MLQMAAAKKILGCRKRRVNSIVRVGKIAMAVSREKHAEKEIASYS